MEWFYQIPGVDELESAESFFEFFPFRMSPPCCAAAACLCLKPFNQKLRANVPLRNLLEDDTRAPWLLARRLLAESYQQQMPGGGQ
jgi:nitrogenase-stabilizing/protective protein